jgi:hypothetical protein
MTCLPEGNFEATGYLIPSCRCTCVSDCTHVAFTSGQIPAPSVAAPLDCTWALVKQGTAKADQQVLHSERLKSSRTSDAQEGACTIQDRSGCECTACCFYRCASSRSGTSSWRHQVPRRPDVHVET